MKLLSFVCLVFLAEQIYSCGITTHLDIAYRAKEYFSYQGNDSTDYRRLINRHEDAFQGSTSYPDVFYAPLCNGDNRHQLAEDTHWTKFTNATVNYIRRTYPKPWSRAGSKLVVFLLGVLSHSVADVSWHNLGLNEGFLDVLAKTNFHDNFDEAHSFGDFGGDVVNQVQLETSYISKLFKWYIPTDDLLNIYEELYGTNTRISEQNLNRCTKLMFIGRLAEELSIIELLHGRFASQGPFLVDRLQDYFLGGMDDMAVWTMNAWYNTIYMLDHGPEACALEKNPLFVKCGDENQSRQHNMKVSHSKKESQYKERRPPLDGSAYGLSEDDLIIERVDRGYTIQASPRIQNLLEEKFNALKEKVTSYKPKEYQTPVEFTTSTSYSRLGSAMVTMDVNNDGYDDVIIGASGHSVDGNYQQGAIFGIYGDENGLNASTALSKDADFMRSGLQLNGRFGTSMAVIDFNADGILDLAVGAPQDGSDVLLYHGSIYVYYGHGTLGLSETPDVTISCSKMHCGLGWSLAANDVNGDGVPDLLMGAPYAPTRSYLEDKDGEQRGFIAAIYSHSKYYGVSYLDEQTFDWHYNGLINSEWMGFSIASAGNYVVAGAPNSRRCLRNACGSYDDMDIQTVGRVVVFTTPLASEPTRVLHGNEEYGQFGYAVALNDEGSQIVIGAASAGEEVNAPGRVYIIDPEAEEEHSILGESDYSRFGASLLMTDINNDGFSDLIVGAPMFSEDYRKLAEHGKTYIFYGKNDALFPEIKATFADVIIDPREAQSRFGTSFLAYGSNKSLLVSSIHSNSLARLSGKVNVFEFNTL